MITAICLNPSIDKTVEINAFHYGAMNRIQSIRKDGSGKGVNVAIACRQIGMDAACIGIMGKEGSEVISQRLSDSDCLAQFIYKDGAVRVNTKVLDCSTQTITEINEAGNEISQDDITKILNMTVEWAKKSEFMIITGSVPPGSPDTLYHDMIEHINTECPTCKCVLDAEGAQLKYGIEAKPFMVKPNLYELQLLIGKEIKDVNVIKQEALRIIEKGVGMVVVSLGGEGAFITNGQQSYFAPVLDVEVKSTVGAGDSMVAGMLHGLTLDLPFSQVFAHGVAAATSSVMTIGTGLIDKGIYESLLNKVELKIL